MATTKAVNSEKAPRPEGGYSQAIETTSSGRMLFISGQIPVSINGVVPASFEDQARLAWENVEHQLVAAKMGLENIVKHTTYLSDRKFGSANSKVRREIFGELKPALTVVVTDIFDDKWFIEIEAIAIR